MGKDDIAAVALCARIPIPAGHPFTVKICRAHLSGWCSCSPGACRPYGYPPTGVPGMYPPGYMRPGMPVPLYPPQRPGQPPMSMPAMRPPPGMTMQYPGQPGVAMPPQAGQPSASAPGQPSPVVLMGLRSPPKQASDLYTKLDNWGPVVPVTL